MRETAGASFSIVVPTRNEEATLADVLASLRVLTDDLIVVDGRSSDRTVEIAEAGGARVLSDNGKGKGDALRVGLAAVRHPIVVFVDADGSHEPADIPRLVAPIAAGEAELVIGSRMLGGSEELYCTISEVIRMMGGISITLAINYRFGVRFTDYQNGFRAIRVNVARSLGLTSDLSTIEQEMAIKCLKRGHRMLEVPSHEYRRKGGESKINVMRLAPIYLWNLLTGLVGPARAPATKARELAPDRISADESIREGGHS